MKLRMVSNSCLLVILLCSALGFVGAFIGSVIITQSGDGLAVPTSQSGPGTKLPYPLPRPDSGLTLTDIAPLINVTIEQVTSTPTIRPTAISPEQRVIPTATPNSVLPDTNSDLGSLDYPLTVTAESYIQGTKVNSYRNSVNATRTAAADKLHATTGSNP